MVAQSGHVERVRSELAAELTDTAFQVLARHGVKGPSVDQELSLWHALDEAVRGRTRSRALPPPGRVAVKKDDLVATLTDAAYRVALEYGFRGSFLDLELDLWRGLCQALRESSPAQRWSRVLHAGQRVAAGR